VKRRAAGRDPSADLAAGRQQVGDPLDIVLAERAVLR